MATESPLDHSELRHIEHSLDEGNTHEAATRLGLLGDVLGHKDAIDFLTTRLLFQRGRIDADGAADRLSAILERVKSFPEAEEWLEELEARTERSVLSQAIFPDPPGAEFDPDTEVPATAMPRPARLSAPPAFQSSLPHPHHPFVDEADDDVTPTEAEGATLDVRESKRPSSRPPPRPDSRARTSKPPAPTTRASREPRASLHPGSEPPTRPSHRTFDSLGAKSQLPNDAGRYRGPSANVPANALAGVPRKSLAPAGLRASAAPTGVERRILEALARLEQGRPAEVYALIPDDPLPDELDPALRAVLARVLLEVRQAERAAKEAALALEEAPDNPAVRLAFIWSAVRHARQRDDAWSLERASRILKQGNLGAAPETGLFDALGACIEARIGTPSVALRLAQRALRSNAQLIDGLAALAEAAASCGEERRAEIALEQLFALSEHTAEQLAPRLRRLGIGELGPTSSASVWLPLEHTLSSGARDAALEGLEALSGEALVDMALRRWEQADNAALTASQFLSEAPVFRHFGPYDLSLASIDRLEAGLGLLYGPGPRALDVAGSSQALWQITGLYLGETLRQSFDGQWQGSLEQLRDSALQVAGRDVHPFQILRHRIAHGKHALLRSSLRGLLEEAPFEAQAFRSARDFAPPTPWGDRSWPSLDELPRLGRALSHSVVALYAFEQWKVSLDRSSNSLSALDRYLDLVVPSDAPLAANTRWARWLCVLLGAYLGEVLCRDFGGTWASLERRDARAFVVRIGDREVAPLSVLQGRVSGEQPVLLAEYTANLRPHGGSI
jgi:hypothetical protein